MSAGVTARSTLAAVRGDRVRALQHVLYRAAKADPERRFHALRDKVYREDVLQRAWHAVRRNNGAPGIDKITLADVEEYGVSRLLGELASELEAGTWRPLPARKVLIPKPGSTERRPLAIAAVRVSTVNASLGSAQPHWVRRSSPYRHFADACGGGAFAARCGVRLLASRVFDGAGRAHVVGRWVQVAMSDTAMGGGVLPCFFGGGAQHAATLVAVRPWVTATLIVPMRPRLGLRGRPAVWRSTASERWPGRGRRGRSTSW